MTCPLLCNARCTVSVVKVVDIPVVTQAILMVSTVLNTVEILQLQIVDKVIDVSVVQVQQVLGGSLWRQSRSHSCSSLIVDSVVRMPVVVQRQVPNGSDVQKTVKVPQLQYIRTGWSMSLLCRSCWRSSSTTSPYGGYGGGDGDFGGFFALLRVLSASFRSPRRRRVFRRRGLMPIRP